MTDVTVEPSEPVAVAADFIATVSLKGDAGDIQVNVSALDDNVYKAVIQAGLDAIFAKANGAAKILAGITKLEGTELDKRKTEVREAAAKTLDQLTQGIIPGAKRAKTSGAEATEAMRLAKNMVKDLIRNSGQKIGAYSAKELTAAAKVVLERNPSLLDLAKKNLADRAVEAKGTKALDLTGLFGTKATSDEVKAKPKVAPTRKKKGDPISAKQAGMAAPRAKPGTGQTAH